MKTVHVRLKQNPYPIYVGENILGRLGACVKKLKIGKDALVITSPVINKLHGRKMAKSLKAAGFSVKVFEVPDGERSKSAAEAMRLMQRIAEYDVLKRPFIVAFGGGVIGDLAGFVAASYKRGIPYVQVPTTFLAQIDSAIGGKTAIDLPVGKNLVGAFYQPRCVYSDVAVLKTLDKRQLRNGLAEAVKYGLIRDPKLFAWLECNYQKVLGADVKSLAVVVARCSQIKTDVVLADEKETKGIRTILNFGHTVGHAIEAAGKFRLYHHGEAIALGMRIAADISVQMKLLSKRAAGRLENLLTAVGLPEKIRPQIKTADVLKLMRHDKKFISGKNRFVLAAQIGRVKIIEGVSLDIIKAAIRKYKK